MTELTRAFCEWAEGFEYADIPEVALPRIQASLADYCGVALAGSATPEAEPLVRYARSQFRDGIATIIGRPDRMGEDGAALVNGTLAHWHEFDDANWSMSGHPTVTIMPALLAVAEANGSSGAELITAYVVGFEIAAKVGLLVNPHQIRIGWHPTATLGSLGAALAVGKLIGLSADQMAMALAVVGSQSSGLRSNFGTMTKPLHAGLAARSGVFAAYLAKEGFIGAPDILGHSHGYVTAFSGGKADYDREEFIAAIGNPLDLVEPGVGYKHFPSSFQTHTGITAMLQLIRDEGVKAENVERILCRGNHLLQFSLIHNRPKRGLQGKLSLEFCLAATLLNGWLAPEHFTDEYINRPEVQDLIERIVVEPHPDMEGLDMTKGQDFLAMEVTIEERGGRSVSRRVRSASEFSLIGVDDDAVSEALWQKFERNAALKIDGDAVRSFKSAVQELASLPDVRSLTASLRT